MLSATIPTRDGYRFLGWSVASTSNMVAYTPGTVYVGNMVLDLYAVWEEIAATTYTVMYDANGGQGAPASQVKTHDIALTLSSTVPTRDGYRFLGWGVSKDAQVTVYSPGSIYLHEIDETARTQILESISRMAQSLGVTEQMKAENPLKWVQMMNSIKNLAEEEVLTSLIYA